MRTHDLGEETLEALLRRLRRIEGQIRGLQKMIAEGRACDEVLTQMTAAKRAMESAAAYFLKEYVAACATEVAAGDAEALDKISEALKKYP